MRRSALNRLYAQIAWLRRELRYQRSPQGEITDSPTSPVLIFTAVVLGLLLAIVEIDLYLAELQALGLIDHEGAIDPVFRSP